MPPVHAAAVPAEQTDAHAEHASPLRLEGHGELVVMFAAPADDACPGPDEAVVPTTVSSVHVAVPMDLLEGCTTLRDVAERAAPLAPLARLDTAKLLHPHAVLTATAPSSKRVGGGPPVLGPRMRPLANGVEVGVAQAKEESAACGATVTFFLPAMALLQARIAHVNVLWTQLDTMCQSKGIKLTPARLSAASSPRIAETTMRTALGRNTYRPPLNGLLVNQVQAALQAAIADGCAALLRAAETTSGDAPPARSARTIKRLRREESELLAVLAPKWRVSSAAQRRELEADTLRHLKAVVDGTPSTAWTQTAVRVALKTRAAIRRPRPLLEM